MILQIIITHYKEDISLPIRLLDSIAMQQCINFKDIGVIIVNDGDNNIITKDIFDKKQYKFNITYYIKEWAGLSAARQYGYLKSTADYIIYCDCDDLFLTNDALYRILLSCKFDYDLLTFGYTRDRVANNNIIFEDTSAKDAARNCMVHGHIYKRQFLINNKIDWLLDVKTWHEDFYYNSLLLAHKPKLATINCILYWWKSNVGSVTDVSRLELHLQEINRIKVAFKLIERLISENISPKSYLLDALFAMYNTEPIAKENNKIDELTDIETKYKINYFSIMKEFTEEDLNNYICKLSEKMLTVKINNKSFYEWFIYYINN